VVFRTLAGATDFASGTLDRARTDETGALILDTAGGLEAGADPAGQYNGGDFLFGTYLSPAWDTGVAVDSVVASWSADTPDGTWLRVDARALQGGVWTRNYTVGVWASGTSVLSRRNGGPQEDENGLVDTDALTLKRSASAVQLSPLWRPAWGTDLAVPERRQNDFPDGGGWCSPASVSMPLAFWAGRAGNDAWDRTVPAVAAGVTPRVWRHRQPGLQHGLRGQPGAGHLRDPLRLPGRRGALDRGGCARGHQHRIRQGGTRRAPMPSSDEHIIVIRGFDRKGDPITNDPATRADQGEKVRIVYDREQLGRAWLGRHGLHHPPTGVPDAVIVTSLSRLLEYLVSPVRLLVGPFSGEESATPAENSPGERGPFLDSSLVGHPRLDCCSSGAERHP